MKILRIASFSSVPPGVKYQLSIEETIMQSSNIDYNLLILEDKKKIKIYSLIRRVILGIEIVKNVKHYDYLFVRYDYCNPFLLMLLFKPKKIILDFHGIDKFEKTSERFSVLQNYVDQMLVKIILPRIKLFTAVTKEIGNYYEKSTASSNWIVYGNGVLFSAQVLKDDKRAGKYKIIMIASDLSMPHHGTIELIRNFQEYCVHNQNLELHLVGGGLTEVLAKLVKSNQWISYHGFLETSEVKLLLQSIDIGLSILNPQSAGLTEGCRIKVRELLSSGVPVVSLEKDAVIPEVFPYYVKLEKINYHDIQDICHHFRFVNKNTVRIASEKWVNKKKEVMRLVEKLNGF